MKIKNRCEQNQIIQLVSYCKEIDLNVIGLMCIPPINEDPLVYFAEMKKLNEPLVLLN